MGPASSFIVFADESGDHGLTRINPNYPIFVLSCCIFRKDDYIDRVCPALQRFKLRWWPHDAIVLHSAQIKRQEPPYAFLQHLDRREEFMLDLTNTLHEMMKFCMERVHSYLCAQGEAESELHFLVERRGNVEDAELRVVFRRVCDGRSYWERAPGFSIEFIDKKANLAGLQVADLVSTPIGRHVHRPEQANRAFEMIRKKFWCSPAREQRGWGFEVFP
jgi:Protein of unknown function (DUF3800)